MALGILLVPVSAAAQGSASSEGGRRQAAAADARKRAEGAIALGYHDEAARWFEAAHRYQSQPEDLLQAAISYDRAQMYAAAATRSLLLVERGGAVAEKAKKLLARLKQRLVLVEVECRSCRIEIDGEPQWSARFFAEPHTPHVGVVERPRGRLQREFTGEAGETVTIESPAVVPDLAQGSPSPATGTDADQVTVRGSAAERESAMAVQAQSPFAQPVAMTGLPPLVAYVGIGTSVALLGTSLGITLHAQSGVKVYEEAAAEARDCTANCDALLARAKTLLAAGRRKELLATVGWIGAGTVSVVAVALAVFLTDWSGDADDDAEAGLRFEPMPMGGAIRLRF